jgi:hypothetical protein
MIGGKWGKNGFWGKFLVLGNFRVGKGILGFRELSVGVRI